MNALRPLTLALTLAGLPIAARAEDPPKTVQELRSMLVAASQDAHTADALADTVRAWFGTDALKAGPMPRVEELDVAWAIEVTDAQAAPRVVSDDGAHSLALKRIGSTNVYAAAVTLPEGFATRWAYEVDGRRFSPAKDRRGNPQEFAEIEVYATPPEARERPDVPHGKLVSMPAFESKIFAGTTRDWWLYVPAQYDGQTPACVMVFQDGQWYKEFIPPVFDNLIASGDMPVTVAVFVTPGTFANGRSNRSFEYDTLSDQYARFLLDELLPAVEKEVKLRPDPAGRAVAGISSGGICAWTVAWERPDQFGKVLSWVGSYTNIASGDSKQAGGHNYPALIRKSPRKPIRVFLQDGARDLDNEHGNWPLANQQMAKALAFQGYDFRFVYGQGFHGNKHGRALLPESLRWLWRDEAPAGSH